MANLRRKKKSPVCFKKKIHARGAAARLPYTVVVEGNVGAGKSTFVDILARDDSRISPVPEPVNAWQNVSGTGVNLLDSMFRDGKRWSGAFQLVSTLSRYVRYLYIAAYFLNYVLTYVQ